MHTMYFCISLILMLLFVKENKYCHDLLVLRVIYKRSSGFDDWIYWHLIHTARDYRQYRAIADLRNLQFTITHALGFSVFTSRILSTDFITVSLSLQITHEVFFAPPNSFLAIILQLPIHKTHLNSIPLPRSSCPGRLASRNSTRLD
jgi:hypothetical protein